MGCRKSGGASLSFGGRFLGLAGVVAVVMLFTVMAGGYPPPPEAGTLPRGFDPNHFTATYYDDTHLNPASLLFTRPYTAPIEFHLECWGETYPFEGCKLIDELTAGNTYSVRWQSRLKVPVTGEYTFYLDDVDDGARLFLDDQPISDQGWNWPAPDVRPSPQTVHLTAGWHDIVVDYEQRPQYIASLAVKWEAPAFEKELIPLAPRALAGVDLRSVTYTNPRGGRYPDPGETLVFHVNYDVPHTRPPLEVTAVQFRVEGGDASWEFDADPSSDFRRATWTIPSDAPPGHYTVSCTLRWRATDGSRAEGSDTTFEGRNFPGPGPKQFTLYQVVLGFLTPRAEAAGAPSKPVDPVDDDADVRIGVVRDDSLLFRAVITPGIDLDEHTCRWRLTGPGRTLTGFGRQFRVTFDRRPGDYTLALSCLDHWRRAKIKVVEVPPPNENDWADDHKPAAAIALATARIARDWARDNEDMLGGGFTNGRADAARHAYWNALMALLMGKDLAAGAGLAHERTNFEDGAPHNETVMDLENNAVGRDIGALTLSVQENTQPLLRRSGGKLQATAQLTQQDVERLLETEPLVTLQIGLRQDVIDALDEGRLTILDDLSNEYRAGLLKPSDQ